jgi:hypothetical protein
MSYSNKTTESTTMVCFSVPEGFGRTHQTLGRGSIVSETCLGFTTRQALLPTKHVHSGLSRSQIGQQMHVIDDLFYRSWESTIGTCNFEEIEDKVLTIVRVSVVVRIEFNDLLSFPHQRDSKLANSPSFSKVESCTLVFPTQAIEMYFHSRLNR